MEPAAITIETPASPPPLADLLADLAAHRERLAAIRGAIEETERTKQEAIRSANAAYSAAVSAAIAQHATDSAALAKMEAEAAASVERAQASADDAELAHLR